MLKSAPPPRIEREHYRNNQFSRSCLEINFEPPISTGFLSWLTWKQGVLIEPKVWLITGSYVYSTPFFLIMNPLSLDLNGIKFHRQGKQPRANDLDRFKKITRSSNGQLSCKGGKKAQQEHEMHQQIHARMMANDAVSFIGESHNLDLIKTIFQTKYPRYNGRDAPLNYNELLEIPDLTNLNPSNWYEKELVRCEQDEDGECVQDLKEQLEDEQHFPSQTYLDPVVVEGSFLYFISI